MVKYCDDPLKRHENKMSKGIRTISEPLYNLCHGRLDRNTALCCQCRKRISDNPRLIIERVLSSPSTIIPEPNEIAISSPSTIGSEHKATHTHSTILRKKAQIRT